MKAKKLLSIILVGVSAVSILAGCSSGNSSQESASVDTAQADTQEDASEETDQSGTQEAAGEDTEEGQETENSGTADGNVLVVYYSATGNTEGVANTIADITGGDLFELKPVEPYTDEELNNIIEYEKEKESNQPKLTQNGKIGRTCYSFYKALKLQGILGNNKTKDYSFIYDILVIRGKVNDIGKGFSGTIGKEKYQNIRNWINAYLTQSGKTE